MNLESIAKAKELEENNPGEALKIYKKLIKKNRYFCSRIFFLGIFSILIGSVVQLKVSHAIELNKIISITLLGLMAFLPPFIFHTWEKFKSIEEKWQKISTKIFSGFILFLSVLLMPIIIYILIIFGVSILAGPFILLLKLILKQPFETIIKSYGLPFEIIATIITIAYFLSPNKGFSSPFPLSGLFRDAITALFLGFRKILSIIVGTMFCLSLYWFWVKGFDSTALLFFSTAGFLNGILLFRIDINLNLGYELDIGMARTLMKLGRNYQARYWLGEAIGILSTEDLSENIEGEISTLAQKLHLKTNSPFDYL